MAVPFLKMNGLGNDFVIIDARSEALRRLPMNAAIAQAIGNRDTGVGCDQIIVLRPDEVDGVDAFMEIFNRDGSQVSACGNATRCVGDIIMREQGAQKATIRTRAGILHAWRADAAGDVPMIEVDMGRPRFGWQEIPLEEEFRDTRGIELQIGPIDDPVLHTPSVVNVGNPHAVFWVDDLEVVDLAQAGPLLENHPVFPEGANISLAKVESPDHIRLKVWERGAGLTKACGTAACAAAVCAARKGLTGRQVRISLPGGDLFIHWREEDDHIRMTGPVEHEFTGELPDELFQTQAA